VQVSKRPILSHDFLKLTLYVVSVLVGGALLSPVLVSGGRWLLETFADPDQPVTGVLESVQKAGFSRYFSRASQICAVLLLWPLIRWTGMNRTLFPGWKPVRMGFRNYFLGFILAAGLLLLLGWGFCQAGIYRLRPEPAWTGIGTPLAAALGAGILEELFFRGAILGLLLRTLKPLPAIVFSSALFAFVHFLRPPETWNMALNDVTWTSGFQALGAILSNFKNTDFLLAEFATLFAVGWVLAAARLRTGQLWASMGLHGGWVFGLKYFSALTLTTKTLRAGDYLPWIGLNLKVGLAPLFVIALTGVIVLLFLRSVPHTSKKELG
jgi:membrane protease YdiL (CAAX protease family)